MKKRITVIVIAVLLIVGFSVLIPMLKDKKEASSNTPDAGQKHYKVGLAQIVEHPSLNTIRDAFLKRMEELGYKEGENITVFKDQANGEPNILTTIMQKYDSEKVDLIVPIATPTAMAAAQYAEKVPVVFSAVSDPVSAELVSTPEKPDKNITGTSDVIQVAKILDLAKEMFPDMKKMGFIYNSSETNSVSNIAKAKEFCERNGIEYKEVNVANTSELSQAVTTLLADCDIIFSPNDNTVASGIDTVANACIEAKKPFFVGADSMVADRGFATIGINYEELGRQTAEMADKVLKGTPVADIPVMEFKENLSIYVNTGVASAIGFEIPDKIKNDSNFVAVE
ncbi:MAG: ABC transporter substrate-binding protein [Eubacteriales bacterium]|nr:ABC transporter substrate-binding protein [Eubacteriales bacterium]